MLFRSSQLDGIRSGEVTLTFRAWTRPQARPGGAYALPYQGHIVVESVCQCRAADIVDADAKPAGYPSLAALRNGIARNATHPVDDDTLLYRIAFRYVAGPKPTAARTRTLHDVLKRLAAVDARAPKPWTAATLAAIHDRPRTPARLLAAAFGRETLPFKTDVRKLKALGLTCSFEVGYELTELGEAALTALQQPTSMA